MNRINKISHKLILYFILILLVSSCIEDYEISDITTVNWRVKAIKTSIKAESIYPGNEYILSFFSNSTYHLNLDINACMKSTFEIVGTGNISFDPMVCTLVCCDSDFAVNMLQLLYSTKTYRTFNHILVLEGTGQIILEEYK